MASSEQVTNVGSLMTPTPFTISPNDSAQSAARLMAATGVGILPVEVAGVGAIIGVLTDRDIVVSVLAEGTPPTRAVREFMVVSPETCTPEDSILNAAQKMAERKIRRLVVVNDRHEAVGVLSLSDIARVHPEVAGMILSRSTEPAESEVMEVEA
jgi:CBS domain-containing protein